MSRFRIVMEVAVAPRHSDPWQHALDLAETAALAASNGIDPEYLVVRSIEHLDNGYQT